MARWVRHVVAVAVVPIVAAGCIGATDRADFDDEVRSRGGGITSTWIDESLDAAAVVLDVADTAELEFLTLSINGTNRIITINGRRGDRPDFVDSVTVRGGEVVATAPIQDADQLPLDDITIRLDALPLDRLEALVDTALTDFGEDDAFVTTITVALTNGVPTIEIGIESARRTGSAAFDLNGNLMGVPR